MGDCHELMLEWLKMVKVVVDSEHFPLNISRERVLLHTILHLIEKNVVKKSPEMFAETAEKKGDYIKLDVQFGYRSQVYRADDATIGKPNTFVWNGPMGSVGWEPSRQAPGS